MEIDTMTPREGHQEQQKQVVHLHNIKLPPSVNCLMQKCQLVPNIPNGTNCNHLCIIARIKWASMPPKTIKRVSKTSENLYNSGFGFLCILFPCSRHHPLSIWLTLNLCFFSSTFDVFFSERRKNRM